MYEIPKKHYKSLIKKNNMAERGKTTIFEWLWTVKWRCISLNCWNIHALYGIIRNVKWCVGNYSEDMGLCCLYTVCVWAIWFILRCIRTLHEDLIKRSCLSWFGNSLNSYPQRPQYNITKRLINICSPIDVKVYCIALSVHIFANMPNISLI